MRIFAVTMAHGPDWDAARALERQAAWDAHADFMNALEAEGFVLLGGTLDDAGAKAGANGGASNGAETVSALLVVRARDEEEVRWRLAADPWAAAGVHRIARVRAWTLRLGEDFATRWVSARAQASKPGLHAAKSPRKPGKAGVSVRKSPGKPGSNRSKSP